MGTKETFMSTDLLVIAGLASEILERHGFVACGRRENGVARVDFWTRDGGVAYRHELTGEDLSVDDVVAACLAAAGREKPAPQPRRISHLS
jgi:hypothetical protein